MYDEKGRLQAFFNGAGENEYRLKRDALGQILEEWDALGNKVSYTYDGNGRQTQVIGPDGNTERYTKYNIWGQILGITDGNGATTHYKRDIWGRITKVKYPGARSKEVREYMTNPDNYYLELNSYNRSEGAKLGMRYDDPEPHNKNNLCKKK